MNKQIKNKTKRPAKVSHRSRRAISRSAASGRFLTVGKDRAATSVVTPGGEAIVMLPRADYERLTGAVAPDPDLGDMTAEDATDIRAYDQVKAALAAGGEEMLTATEVEVLAAAKTPMLFWRKKRRMTQGDIAAVIGTTQSHISEIETGGTGMSFDTAQKIAAALGVTLDDLAN
jgi:DNA-binding XRE family transcriptional regulator